MQIGIVREIHPEERRIAASPSAVRKLIAHGFSVVVESGAGEGSSYPNSAYEEVGATIAESAAEVWGDSDIVAKVRPPGVTDDGIHEADLLGEGKTLVSFIYPAQNPDLLDRLAARKATVMAMDCVPRISRAQKLDALSSMANIAGYRAVVEASNQFGSFFTGQFTAAGKVPPARVLIIGAGVAGLAAVGAARALGAVVRAFDTRAAVKDQVESLGGEFLELQFEESGEGTGGYAKVMSKEFIDAEMALFREQAKEVDIVITTALIPGKKAPTLWTKDMVEAMRPGSVVVDLASEQGGNCECTEPGKIVKHKGVTIIGYRDLPSRMGNVASDLYGTNIAHLLDEMGKADNYTVDESNNVVRGTLVMRDGELKWPPPKIEDPSPKTKPAPAAESVASKPAAEPAPKREWATTIASVAVLGWAVAWFAMFRDATVVDPSTAKFVEHVTVFVLACFVGWQVVWSVAAALHTPLMSVTNAISGIIIVGGLLGSHGDWQSAPVIISAVAALFATINIAGGFLVTQRMLKMFRR